jgi:hypothetical protein
VRKGTSRRLDEKIARLRISEVMFAAGTGRDICFLSACVLRILGRWKLDACSVIPSLTSVGT